MRVVVTNADYANSLAAVRSLGKKGIEVVSASHKKHSQAFYSKYSAERLVHPSPEDEGKFVEFMLGYLQRRPVDVLLPIGYDVNVIVSRHMDEFSRHTKAPVSPRDSMKVASDKALTMKLAADLGVGVPRTYKDKDEVDSFPIVVKDKGGSGRMRYVNSREELAKLAMPDSIIQEYIPGTGYGFFALMNKGELRAHFMHRRIREYPVTGGASTAAESVSDPELKELGLKLLKKLKWHGVAMAEFKKDDRDGTFKLMEINPKFWGSLDLSIASGVDFPYLAVKMAKDGDVEPVAEYKLGIRFHWTFPYDVLHVLARPSSVGPFLRDCLSWKTKSNVWSSDIKPNLFQVATTFGAIASRAASGKMRHPHGFPRKI